MGNSYTASVTVGGALEALYLMTGGSMTVPVFGTTISTKGIMVAAARAAVGAAKLNVGFQLYDLCMFLAGEKPLRAPTGNRLYDTAKAWTETATWYTALLGLQNPRTYGSTYEMLPGAVDAGASGSTALAPQDTGIANVGRALGAGGLALLSQMNAQAATYALTIPDAGSNVTYPSGVSEGGTDVLEPRNINGQRTSRYRQLSDDEISQLLDDIEALEADPSIFRFNEGNQTGFLDSEGIINVRGDVLPDLNSTHPRDLMSPSAVLAHEYYGHKHFDDVFGVRNPLPGSWNDEFRASYNAAINAPNLSDMDRMYLMLDALERAKEAGVNIKITDIIRRILYGY